MKSKSYLIAAVAIVLLSSANASIAGNDKDKGLNLPEPNYDFRTPSAEKVELGRNLMFDKILSGNKIFHVVLVTIL